LLRFILNNREIETGLPAGTTLLDFIRYHQNLMGTKIGCREGDCGACTVLVGEVKNNELEYRSATSCLMALGNATGKHIVTVEGVNNPDGLNPVQQAMADEGATQCGFCTPGFVVSLAGFCLSTKKPSYVNAVASVDGNICRCTGYKSIERAAAKISKQMQERKEEDVIEFVTKKSILPSYFSSIKMRLGSLASNGMVNRNGGTKLLGGGTDLYVQQPETMIHSEIEFLFDKQELKGIKIEDEKCIVAASATVTDIFESSVFQDHFPGLSRFIKLVSSTPIRNMATIAGNFVNASPIGDLTIFFLALDAQLVLRNGSSKRELPLRKFYKGYKQLDKLPEEFIESIWFQLPDKKTLFNFEKVSKRTHLDIASVNAACCLKMNGSIIESASLSAGGVGPVPMFLQQTSAWLTGKELTEEIVEQSIGIAQKEISPISDARGSEEYKRMLLGQLIRAHFVELFPAGWQRTANA
jgi:xanthine dehydrogenase small subunit